MEEEGGREERGGGVRGDEKGGEGGAKGGSTEPVPVEGRRREVWWRRPVPRFWMHIISLLRN